MDKETRSGNFEEAVLQRLAETANRERVIEEICLSKGLHWDEAAGIVDHVLNDHHYELVRRQSPVLVLLALSVFIAGVALVSWVFFGVLAYVLPIPGSSGLEFSNLARAKPDFFLALSNLPHALPGMITGLAMIFGSYLGMRDVWASFFDALDQRRLKTIIKTSQDPKTFGWGVREQRNLTPYSIIMISFACILTGTIWVGQFVVLFSRQEQSHPGQITNFWQLVFYLGDIANFARQYPWLYALLGVGLVLLAGGALVFYETWNRYLAPQERSG